MIFSMKSGPSIAGAYFWSTFSEGVFGHDSAQRFGSRREVLEAHFLTMRNDFDIQVLSDV